MEKEIYAKEDGLTKEVVLKDKDLSAAPSH
jgi:hypothetical protein